MAEGDNTVIAYMKHLGWTEHYSAGFSPNNLTKFLNDAVRADLELRGLDTATVPVRIICDIVMLQSVKPLFRMTITAGKAHSKLTGYSIRELLCDKNLAQLYLTLRTVSPPST